MIMGDRKTCPYCKVDVSEGIFCAGCSKLYDTSCSGRVGADDQGRFYKCCGKSNMSQQRSISTAPLGEPLQSDSGFSSRVPSPTVSDESNGLIREFHALSAWIKNQLSTIKTSLEVNTCALKATNENLHIIQSNLAILDGRVSQNAMDISALKLKLQDLSASPSLPSTSSSQQLSSPSPVDTVAAELQDRLRCASNIIMYNLPMSNGGDDLVSVRQALGGITSIDLVNISARRVTKSIRKGSPPPIIVKLSSSDDVGRVLRNWRLIPADIQVAADRTKTQREGYKKLRIEADAFNKRNPGSRKVVKYVNGLPVLSMEKKN